MLRKKYQKLPHFYLFCYLYYALNVIYFKSSYLLFPVTRTIWIKTNKHIIYIRFKRDIYQTAAQQHNWILTLQSINQAFLMLTGVVALHNAG